MKSNLKIFFNTKFEKIYQFDVEENPNTVEPVTKTIVSTGSCHGNLSSERSNIIDFDVDLSANRVIWMSWNERLYSSKFLPHSLKEDELLFWYDFYDYVQFSDRRIAVDNLNEKIYSIDRFVNPTVEVVDMLGKHRSILFGFAADGKIKDKVFEDRMPSDLEAAEYEGMLFFEELPLNIVLDSYEAVMFIRTNISWNSRVRFMQNF